MDYFKLLDLEEQYDLDLQNLNKQYLLKQAKYHPDMAKSPPEKREYQAISIDLNKAYAILKNDLKRAEYLLSLKGIDISDASLRDKVSNEELQKIWSNREKVEDTNSMEELRDLLTQKMTEQQELVNHLANSFKLKKFDEALDLTITFKYLVNLIDNIKQKIKDAHYRD